MKTKRLLWILCLAMGAMFFGCDVGPEPIAFGNDSCAFCKMTIVDPKFGAELITDKGRILKYDAAECLVDHLEQDAPAYRQLLAVAYDQPGHLHPVDSLAFVVSPDYRSPMGANLAGVKEPGSLRSAHDPLLSWQEVRNQLAAH